MRPDYVQRRFVVFCKSADITDDREVEYHRFGTDLVLESFRSVVGLHFEIFLQRTQKCLTVEFRIEDNCIGNQAGTKINQDEPITQ